MQIASSASWTASDSRSASLYATTASTPSSRQARRIRSAISPRLAMRTLRNTIRRPPSCDANSMQDQLLAVLDRLARLDQAGADDAVRRRDDLLGDAEHVDRAEPVAGADPGPGPRVRARLEDADRRRGRHDPAAVASRRRSRPLPASRPARSTGTSRPSRPGPTGVRLAWLASWPSAPARRVAPDRPARSRSARFSRPCAGWAPSPGGAGGPASRPRGPRARRARWRRAWRSAPGSSSSARRSMAAWSAARSAAERSG